MRKNINLIIIFALAAVMLKIYLQILNGFFQQDEWLGFARFITHQNENLLELLKFAFSPYSLHYTPLAFLSGYWLFAAFHLNYQAYAIVSILLHVLSSVLVFYFAKSLFQNYKLGLFSALLFAGLAAGFQATAWPVADLAIHGATIFGLLSLTFSLNYLKQNTLIYLWLSIIFFLISLLFKEITISLMLLIPLFFSFFSEKSLKKNDQAVLLFFLAGGFYVSVRGFFMFVSQNTPSAQVVNSTTFTAQPIFNIIYNLITFPAKALSQSFFPQELLLKISRYIAFLLPRSLTGEKFSSTFNIFAEQRVLEALSLLIFVILAVVIIYFWKSNTDDRSGKIIGFGFLFVILNSLIFAFSPERTGIINIIDSRNLYFLSIGMVILIIAMTRRVCQDNLNKMILCLLPLFLLNLYYLQSEITTLKEIGITRRTILEQIKEEYPKLPKKVVFYTKSDYSYYGLPDNEKILPFQSGLGQTLLVWYEENGKFPKDFYNKRFLWEIREQGYYESGGRGFGYFRDYSKLVENMIKYHLPVESIISLSWSHENLELIDTTSNTQRQLKEELNKEN